MFKKLMKLSLAKKVLIGIVLGTIAGLAFGESMGNFAFIGDMWISALKIPIHPLILSMLILSIGAQDNLTALGKTSYRILFYYLLTTVIASVNGIVVTELLQPGRSFTGLSNVANEGLGAEEFSIVAFLETVVPDNFLAPIAEGNMLHILVLGVLCGIGILKIKDAETKGKVIGFFQKIQSLCSAMLGIVVDMAPVAVFFVIGNVVGTTGMGVFVSLSAYLGTFAVGLIAQILLVYCTSVAIFAKVAPWTFIKNLSGLFSMAIATCSSLLCIKVNGDTVVNKYNVDPKISAFCIPLGATINMDAGAIFYPSVIIFTAQAFGITLPFGSLLYMVFLSSLISSAGGGYYGGALVKLTFMADAFGVPGLIVTMLGSIFSIIDMFITFVNCAGDQAGTIVVDRLAKRDLAKKQKSEIS